MALLLIYRCNKAGTFSSLSQDAIPNPVANIKITEVTAEYVKGTFSANLYDDADLNTIKYKITDGEFYAMKK